MDKDKSKAATKRRHSEEFRRQVVGYCLEPGVLVAEIARANGLNANLVRRWIKDHRAQVTGVPERNVQPSSPPAVLVPVTLAAVPAEAISGEIRIDLRRGATALQLAWPVGHAALLGNILKDLLS